MWNQKYEEDSKRNEEEGKPRKKGKERKDRGGGKEWEAKEKNKVDRPYSISVCSCAVRGL